MNMWFCSPNRVPAGTAAVAAEWSSPPPGPLFSMLRARSAQAETPSWSAETNWISPLSNWRTRDDHPRGKEGVEREPADRAGFASAVRVGGRALPEPDQFPRLRQDHTSRKHARQLPS